MKKKTLALVAAMMFGSASQAVAQVNDVNFTASATSGYNSWNSSLNLGGSAFWGAKAGFSFGPVLEINALYEKSFNLKGKLQGAGWSVVKNWGNDLEGSSANMERIGGEVRLNIVPIGWFTPYVTAGTGVMNIRYKDVKDATKENKDEQVYASLGAGFKFNLWRRLAISLEARDLIFNVNKNNAYLAQGKDADKTLHNFGGRLALDVFLGGHKSTKDDISRAYRNQFSDGFRSMKFVVEPGVAYVDFADKSLFRDQWFVGGTAGIDFSSYLGLRGFYYQATYNPSKLWPEDWSKVVTGSLKMYGGNLVARLNMPRGVTPYLNLGGGYLDVKTADYNDSMMGHNAKSGWFAMGGAGLEIPLGRYVALNASANAMLNNQDNPDPANVTDLSQVKVAMMYKGGITFNIGAKNRDGQAKYQDYATGLVNAEKEANMKKLNEVRADYEKQIEELNAKLVEAVKRDDVKEVQRLVEKKKEVKKVVEVVEQAKVAEVPSPKYKVMTEAQLEALIARVTKKNTTITTNVAQGVSQMSDLDKILLFSALNNGSLNLYPQANNLLNPTAPEVAKVDTVFKVDTIVKEVPAPVVKENEDAKATELEARIKALEKKIENSKKEMQIKALEAKLQSLEQESKLIDQPIVVAEEDIEVVDNESPAQEEIKTIEVVKVSPEGEVTAEEVVVEKAKKDSFLSLSSIDPYLGVSFGGGTTFNVGTRANFQVAKTDFYLSPEAFVGFGSATAWGLYANAIYKMSFLNKFQKFVTPYVGFGGGFTHAGATVWGSNIIIGTQINNILGGKLFVDYSARSLFDMNQIAVGYSINF